MANSSREGKVLKNKVTSPLTATAKGKGKSLEIQVPSQGKAGNLPSSLGKEKSLSTGSFTGKEKSYY